MKEILEFIFQDFVHYIGTLVLIVMTGHAIAEATSRWFTVRIGKDKEQ